MSNFLYMVIRMDDHGNTALVRDRLALPEANRLVSDLTVGAHKQTYDILGYQNSIERERLLRLRGVVSALNAGADRTPPPV
jgi:hypothetical protein